MTQLTPGGADYVPVGTGNGRIIRLLGRVVDREPGELHVNPLTSERDALGFEEPALRLPFGQRPVSAHDALPGNAGILARGQHRAGEARRAGRQVPVGGDEAGGDRTDTPQDPAGTGGLNHSLSIHMAAIRASSNPRRCFGR
jgi:hypothetical protein